jgi:hypothetical protein
MIPAGRSFIAPLCRDVDRIRLAVDIVTLNAISLGIPIEDCRT